jgi:hypothetical protein
MRYYLPMQPKTIHILYWITTILFVLFLIADGLAGVLHAQSGVQSLLTLGYPLYVLTIVGSAKLFAAVAIIQTRFVTIKEWAFAGFTIDTLGAASSWYFLGDYKFMAISLVFLAIMFIPYYFWKQKLAMVTIL